MQRHWERVAPPLYVCMAAFVGFKPKSPPPEDSDEGEILEGEDLLDMLRSMGVMS